LVYDWRPTRGSMRLSRESPCRGRLIVLAVLAVASRPLAAHHSFAMFDSVNKTTITGTVTRFEWTNPHVFIEVDVPGGGEVKHWSVELGSPSILLRSGWKFSDVKPGDK